MFELLSTGLPILNFYYRKDSQFEIIEKYPLGINVRIDGEIGWNFLNLFAITIRTNNFLLERL